MLSTCLSSAWKIRGRRTASQPHANEVYRGHGEYNAYDRNIAEEKVVEINAQENAERNHGKLEQGILPPAQGEGRKESHTRLSIPPTARF